MENQTTPCKALVLAGGGARGSYQVGVWKALMELDWHPQIITGTSVGSLNGAMFVLDLYEVARVIKGLMFRERKRGLSNGERKMLHTARQILLSELVLAEDSGYEEVERRVEQAMLQTPEIQR